MPSLDTCACASRAGRGASRRRPNRDEAFELVDVPPREVDVLAAGLDCLLDVGAFGELVPRLSGEDMAAALDRLLQLGLVVPAALTIGVETVPLRSTSAVLRVFEARADLGDGQLRRRIEAERRGTPRVQAIALD